MISDQFLDIRLHHLSLPLALRLWLPRRARRLAMGVCNGQHLFLIRHYPHGTIHERNVVFHSSLLKLI